MNSVARATQNELKSLFSNVSGKIGLSPGFLRDIGDDSSSGVGDSRNTIGSHSIVFTHSVPMCSDP